MKTDYESPLEHSSSPDGCREDCPACEDERLRAEWENAVGESDCSLTFKQWLAQRKTIAPYPGPFWFDAEDGTICFRDEHQTVCRLADVPDYDDPIQAATAAHIVLCVNSHDRLKAALEHVLSIYGGQWTESTRNCVRAALTASQP